MHGKDISIQQSESERGQKTGTPVGLRLRREGVIDWARIVEIARHHGFQGVISVECGTVDQADRSLKYLQGVVS